MGDSMKMDARRKKANSGDALSGAIGDGRIDVQLANLDKMLTTLREEQMIRTNLLLMKLRKEKEKAHQAKLQAEREKIALEEKQRQVLAVAEKKRQEQVRELKRELAEAEDKGVFSQAHRFLNHMSKNRSMLYEAFHGFLSIFILATVAYLYFTTFRPGLTPAAECTAIPQSIDNQAFLSSCFALQGGLNLSLSNATHSNLFESGALEQLARPKFGPASPSQMYSSAMLSPNASCRINPPTSPSFIIRLDDVQSYAWSSLVVNITEDTLKKNMSIVWGVIPENIDSNPATTEYMRRKADDPRVEFAQHGFNHSQDEFLGITSDELVNMTLHGTALLRETFGIYPTTFIPPYNSYNNSVTPAFSNTSIRILSGRQGEYRFDGAVLYVGYTSTTKRYQGDEAKNAASSSDLVPVSELLSACAASFDRNNLCVIMVHPQDFVSDDRRSLDIQKYSSFLQLLDGLKKTGAKSILFRDLIACEEANTG